uniref:Uncharacterized protein n=1 Tax=viral metagenome TaxID=1070528 RepID=A0A6M3X7R1_9ZZZZ
MKRNNKISLKDISYLITWFLSPFIIYGLIVLMFGCKDEIVSPTLTDISGRYDNAEYSMILYLSESNGLILADLEWSGYVTRLEGHFDRINNQLIMSGNFFGNQNISFNLIYGDDKSLAGGFNYVGQFAPIKFRFVNELKKHQQGGLYSQ